MAAKRGKSQARRNTGNNSSGMPGWAWMILGVVLALVAVLFVPKMLDKSGKQDGFFRPTPNPDARPDSADGGTDAEAVAGDDARKPAARSTKPKATRDPPPTDTDAGDGDYDFYTLLPGQEVQMTDAQIAAAAKAEQARALQQQKQEAARQAAATRAADVASTANTPTSRPVPLSETSAPVAPATPPKPVQPTTVANTPAAVTTTPLPDSRATTPPPTAAATPAPAAASTGGNQTPYILQAGAFGASGDAEATKAKIAMLGLNARVESAQINGKTVYRVRMGPYATASELSDAKGKLANGGLPAMAIKAR